MLVFEPLRPLHYLGKPQSLELRRGNNARQFLLPNSRIELCTRVLSLCSASQLCGNIASTVCPSTAGILCGRPSEVIFDIQSMAESATKDKPLSCQFCGKTFGRSEHLKRHVLTHTRSREFQCRICRKAFFRKSVTASSSNKIFRQSLTVHIEMPYLDTNTRTRHLDQICFNEEAEPVYLVHHPKPVVQDKQHVPDVNNDRCNALILSHHQMTKPRLGRKRVVLISMKVCSNHVPMFVCKNLNFSKIPEGSRMK